MCALEPVLKTDRSCRNALGIAVGVSASDGPPSRKGGVTRSIHTWSGSGSLVLAQALVHHAHATV